MAHGALLPGHISDTTPSRLAIEANAEVLASYAVICQAQRVQLYKKKPAPDGWHDEYAKGLVSTGEYSDALSYQDVPDVNSSHGNDGDEH